MYNIDMFVEDHGHEAVLKALVNRLAKQSGVAIRITLRTSKGGHGRVLSTLKEYIRDLKKGGRELADLLIVAIDGNCTGYSQCKQEIDQVTQGFAVPVICAIPDPHIERWLLLDATAFKKVVGKGCSAPAQKCDRGHYKRLLIEAIQQAGKTAFLEGLEYAEDLVNEMDLERVERVEDSLGKFLKSLRQQLQTWQRAMQQ
jgi:hypothetical protein